MQLKRSFQNTLQITDGHTVVGHGDVLRNGGAYPREHMAPRDHTASALQNELVGREIRGEVLADHHFDVEFSSHGFFKPPGQFFAADIIRLRMVRAGLADHDFVAGL